MPRKVRWVLSLRCQPGIPGGVWKAAGILEFIEEVFEIMKGLCVGRKEIR